MYFIIKPKEGKTSVVKSDMEEFLEKIDNTWGIGTENIYFPEAAQLVEDKMVKEENNYLIYIISQDNKLVYNTIVESK